MSRKLWILTALFLVGCQSEEEANIERLETELASVKGDLSGCDAAETELLREQGKISLAEWDAAAATDLDEIDPDQEMEIRRSLGDKMGIPPSKVDWKEIYKSRADAARSKLAGENYALEFAQRRADELCREKLENLDRAHKLQNEIRKLGGVV